MAQVDCHEREVTRGGESTVEVTYLITSVPPAQADAATLLGWLRGHWGIENRLHYVRDVTMGEDANRTRVGSGPQVLAALRNLAISKLRAWHEISVSLLSSRGDGVIPLPVECVSSELDLLHLRL